MSSAGSSKELQLLQGIDCRCALLQQQCVELDCAGLRREALHSRHRCTLGHGFPIALSAGVA